MQPKTMTVERDQSRSAMQPGTFEVDDRRQEPRYVPMMERAYLGWWEGESFRTELGRLANISARGAALEVPADPGVGEAVWLCVIGPSRMGWVAARLLGRTGTLRRMVFAERFPYELFKTVVWGFPGQELLSSEEIRDEEILDEESGDIFSCGVSTE